MPPRSAAAAPTCARVVIVADFHVHLSAVEVGGLLAGSYDAASRTLKINRAYPVLEVSLNPTTLVGANEERPAVTVEFEPEYLKQVGGRESEPS